MNYKTINNQFVSDRIQALNCRPNTTANLLGETYSQCYEDIILVSLVQADLSLNPNAVKVIEIGANHPIANSNSVLLEQQCLADVVLYEAIPELAQHIKQHRPQATVINAAVVPTETATVDFYIGKHNEVSGCDRNFVEQWHQQHDTIIQAKKITVPAVDINTVLEQHLTSAITVLSIDCEGLDLDLLCAIDFTQYLPRYICVEHRYLDKSITKQLTKVLKKYTLLAQTDINSIFKVNV